MPSVHPRVCGEQGGRGRKEGIRVGSSPRVRGTVPRYSRIAGARRFIPASAGNSDGTNRSGPSRPVHPRVCGEQWSNRPIFRPPSGSSPRVRGTGVQPLDQRPELRFIPACAGNSRNTPTAPLLRAVHPRVCGEQFSRSSRHWRICGSSPRVRGTGMLDLEADNFTRFIPACAGNSVTGR